MKILYAVQATGNGHIARATELLPVLQRHGQVDVFLSGSNSSIDVNLPVAYRSMGLSLFYGNRGGLDYLRMLRSFAPARTIREVMQLPVEKYDLVINDFEAISSLACRHKNIPFVHFGHQASFASSNVPRPKSTDIVGEWLLRYYASSQNAIGLHFDNYDDFIYQPVIKKAVLEAAPSNQGHITVYLGHYSEAVITRALLAMPETCFHVFSREAKQVIRLNNLVIMPVNNKNFTESLINSAGVITGAGFETPAEALYLGKRLLCLPIRGQYEQLCNAAALEDFGVPIIQKIDASFQDVVRGWLDSAPPRQLILKQTTNMIIEQVIETGINARFENEAAAGNLYPAI
jgi:uncharacterized protein (TIGR00661 family)